MYALERLAQDDPDNRQTIVNVLCAYLRMPYTATDPLIGDDRTTGEHGRGTALQQERQVRLTAQRLLLLHLQPGSDPARPVARFWQDIDLDLTGATLISFDLNDCRVRTGRFDGARFIGDSSFIRTRFDGNAWFRAAQFSGNVRFLESLFGRRAEFRHARFEGEVTFDGVRCDGDAGFHGAWFAASASFGQARFSGSVDFSASDGPGSPDPALVRVQEPTSGAPGVA